MKKLHVSFSIAVVISVFCATALIYQKYYEKENQHPIAFAGYDKYVDVGEIVIFCGIGYDPDGGIVLEEWDFDGDGKYDWSSIEIDKHNLPQYNYNDSKTYDATFRVTDNQGAQTIATCKVYVNWGLTLSISLPKTNFGSEEPINVTATLKNVKDYSIYVSELWWGCKNLDYITIYNETKKINRKLPVIPGIPKSVLLEPNCTLSETVELRSTYELNNLHGQFSLQGIYLSGYGKEWRGRLYSNKLTFTISLEYT